MGCSSIVYIWVGMLGVTGGWRVGKPLGSETSGGLSSWPLAAQLAGLIKGAGLGYMGAAVHQAVSHSGAGPRLSLYGAVEHCHCLLSLRG